MNKKTLIVSILGAVLIVLASLTSVIGINVVKSNAEKGNIASPLFETRLNSATKKNSEEINTNYIGKGNLLNLFISRQTSPQRQLNRVIRFIELRPDFLNSIIAKIETNPEIQKILIENDVSMDEVKNQVNLIKNDPSLLRQMVDEDVFSSTGDTPQPLGLSTSNPLGCFITLIALIPVGIIITMLIATILIFTCLNIQGCFETLFENIMTSIMQGLTPP